MKPITHNGETHTLKEWIEILKLSEKAENDILVDFAKELVFDGKITNENLYKAYTLWYDGTPMPSSVFVKRIAKTFKEHRPDLQRYRINTARGWEKV